MSFAARAFAACALAALTAAAQLAPLVHLVLVPHVTCAAHGELVHGSPSSATQDDDVAFTASAKGDEHEHCLTLSAQRSAVISSSRSVAVGVAPKAAVRGEALPARPTLAVLEVAPKASPPV